MSDLQLKDVIYHALHKGHEDETPRDYIGISAISFCQRQSWLFIVKGIKRDLDESTLLRFLVGTATHEYLLALLWKHRGKVEAFKFQKGEKEVKISRPGWTIPPLKGHLDLKAIINGKSTIADFKIVGSGYYAKIHEAPEHNKIQLMLYAYAERAEQCLLAFVNKDNGRIKEFVFKPDPVIIAKMLDKYHYIMTSESEPEIPFENPTDGWECGWCQFADRCWPGQSIEKKDGVVLIPFIFEEQYIEACHQIRDLEEQKEHAKSMILSALDGKKGKGQRLSATYIQPSDQVKYDSAKLRAKIDPTQLKKCENIQKGKPYYLMRIKT